MRQHPVVLYPFLLSKSLGEGYRPDDLEKIISGEMERDPEIRKQNAKPEKKVDMLIDIQAKLARCEGSVCKRDSFEADQGTDLKNVLLLSVH